MGDRQRRKATPLRGLRVCFTVAATASLLIVSGNPLASVLGLGHWSAGTDHLRKIHFLESAGETPAVLLLGSSKVLYDVTPVLLQEGLEMRLGAPVPTFNAAQPGTGVTEASWLLGELVSSLGCPRVVVADVSAEGLNAASLRLERALEEYLPPARWLATVPELRRLGEWEAALVGLTRGWGNLLHAAARPPSRAPGARPLALVCQGGVDGPTKTLPCGRRTERTMEDRSRREWKRLFAWQRTRLEDLHRLDHFRLGGLPSRSLRRLTALAEGCGARLLLTSLPSMVPYREWGYGPAVEAALREAEAVAEASPAALWLAPGAGPELEPRDFMDPGHLSVRGSRRLTAHLVPIVEELLRAGPVDGRSGS